MPWVAFHGGYMIGKFSHLFRDLGRASLILLGLNVLNQPAIGKQASTDILPINTFASLPNFSAPQLSPDGNKLGYLTYEDGRRLLMVLSLDGEGSYAIPPQFKAEITGFQWATSDALLLTLRIDGSRRGISSQKVAQTRVVAYRLSTRKAKWLGEPKDANGLETGLKEMASQLETVIDLLPQEPEKVLISLDLNVNAIREVYKVHLDTGRRVLVKPETEGVQNWYTDRSSELRLGIGFRGAGSFDDRYYAVLKEADNNWSQLTNAHWYNQYDIKAFSSDPNIVYVTGNSKHDRTGLFALSLNTGKVGASIFSNADKEVLYTIFDRETRTLAGVGFFDGTIREQYFDASLSGLQASMQNASPGSVVTVVDWLKSKGKYVLSVSSDTNPGSYYLFDAGTGKLSALANARDDIDPTQMAPVRTVTMEMRDGGTIQAFVTMPKDKTDGPIPFIVLPHGGPKSFDAARWDYWPQFYANRGYGVIQPNFRGSTGYGEAFMRSGNSQWGGRMQQDITDATHWVINQGLANKDRICIVGNSFGGYAALMGAVQEKDLYRCAVSVNGVTDLPDLKSFDKNFVGGDVWLKSIRLEGADDETVSPYHQAEHIQVPVLLLAAKDDTRVPFRQADRMYKRLRKLKKDAKLVEIKNGGHGLLTMASRQAVLRATEKFLARHLEPH